MSERNLRRVFRDVVGMSPKEFARLTREVLVSPGFAPPPVAEKFRRKLRGIAQASAQQSTSLEEVSRSVGNLDDHLPRAREFYDMLQRAGLYPRGASPTYSDCQVRRARPNSSHCTAAWPGFWLYPNVAHHYRALIPAFPPAFEWQLATLTEMVGRLQNGPRSPGAPICPRLP